MVSIAQANDRKLFLRVLFLVLIASTIVQPSFAVDGSQSSKSWFSFGWLKVAMGVGAAAGTLLGPRVVSRIARGKVKSYKDQAKVQVKAEENSLDFIGDDRQFSIFLDDIKELGEDQSASLHLKIVESLELIEIMEEKRLNLWLGTKYRAVVSESKDKKDVYNKVAEDLVKKNFEQWQQGNYKILVDCQDYMKQEIESGKKIEVSIGIWQNRAELAEKVTPYTDAVACAIGGVTVAGTLWNQYQQSPASKTSLFVSVPTAGYSQSR